MIVYGMVRVVDALTKKPIAGALVSVDNRVAGATTADGLVQVSVTASQGSVRHTFKAKADAFADGSITANEEELFHSAVDNTPLVITLGWGIGSQWKVLTVQQPGATPLPGALVFLDGQGAKTADSQGAVTLVVGPGRHQVIVGATGYKQQTIVFYDRAVPDHVILDPEAPVSRDIQITFEPTIDAPEVAVTLSGDVTINTTVDTFGVAKFPHLANGHYTLTYTRDGYAPNYDLVVSDGQDAYVIQLIKEQPEPAASEDQPTSPGQAEQAANNAAVLAAAPDTATPDSEEFIYPNSTDGKYFTTTQARMYIGNLFIDELDSVQFAGQVNRIPLYGYASTYKDGDGKGKSLVQGQLVINLVSEGYLKTVLEEYGRFMQAKPQMEERRQELKNLIAQKDDLNAQLSASISPAADPLNLGEASRIRGMSSSSTNLQKQISDLDDRIAQLAAQVGSSGLRQVKQSLQTLPGDDYINPIYKDVYFDIEIQLEGGGRTVKRRLEKCLLTGDETILSQDGSVLKDCYSFTARRLR